MEFMLHHLPDGAAVKATYNRLVQVNRIDSSCRKKQPIDTIVYFEVCIGIITSALEDSSKRPLPKGAQTQRAEAFEVSEVH